MAAGDLTTSAAVVQYGRIADSDMTVANAIMDRLVSAASAAMRSLTSRYLAAATYTAEVYSGDKTLDKRRMIYLREYPVTAVTSVSENGSALTLATGYSTTAQVLVSSEDGTLFRQNVDQWLPGRNNIVVTYAAGYTFPRSGTNDLPYDLEQGVIELALLMFNEAQRIGEKGKAFSDWKLEYERGLNPTIDRVLATYERGFRP
jgi:hypothetical protein